MTPYGLRSDARIVAVYNYVQEISPLIITYLADNHIVTLQYLMGVRVYVCVFLYMYVYVCIYVSMYVCVYVCIYEGWNFNSDNYLFTTDTK